MDSVFKLGAVVSLSDLASSEISKLNDKWLELKKTLGDSHSEIQKVEAGLKNMKWGSGMIAASVGIKAALAPSVDEARKFEKELALLGATANASSVDMKKFSDIALQTGLNTAFSPQEAVQGLTALASAGIEGTKAINDALLPALDLAAASAGKLSIDNAAADMAATMMSFKNQGVQARQVVDTFVNMANVASFSIQDLGAAWRGVNLAASSTNQSLSTTGAVMAALKNSGSTVIESGEGVRMALSALASPSSIAKKELDKLKVSAYDSNGKFRDLIEIFKDLEKATGKMSEADRNATLNKILHEGGVKAFRATVVQGIDKVTEWKATLDKSGTASDFAKRQLVTYDGSLKMLEGSWQTLKVLIGNTLIPAFNTFAIGLNSAVAGVARFANENEGLTKAFGWAVAGLSAFLAIAGGAQLLIGSYKILNGLVAMNVVTNSALRGVMMGVTAIKNLFNFSLLANSAATSANTISRQITIAVLGLERTGVSLSVVMYGLFTGKIGFATAAQWAFNSALAANPVGLVIVGVVALGVAIYALAKNWDVVTLALQKSWTMIENNKIAFGLLALAFAPITIPILAFSAVVYGLANSWDSVTSALSKAWEMMKKVMGFFGMKFPEDPASVKLKSDLEILDKSISGIESKKSNLLKMGFKDDSDEVKKINESLIIAQSQRKYKSFELEGTVNYEGALKDVESKKKLVESAMASASKAGNQAELDSLKKRLEEINEESKKIHLMDFTNDAKNKALDSVNATIKKTTESTKDLKKAVDSVDYSKMNNEAIVKMNMANMDKMQEQMYYHGKKMVSTFNTGASHQGKTEDPASKQIAQINANFLPQSDAKIGPLSQLTKSGRALVSTFDSGIEKGLDNSNVMDEFGLKFNPMASLQSDLKSSSIESSVVNNSSKGNTLNIGSLIKDLNLGDSLDGGFLGELLVGLMQKENGWV